MKLLLLLILMISGCAKNPCVITVDVGFKQGSEITATATKKVKCGDQISFPFHGNTATKFNELKLIDINFFQGARVVRADIVYGTEFKDGVFNIEYGFPDTNPDLMVWRVYNFDEPGWVQYETRIK